MYSDFDLKVSKPNEVDPDINQSSEEDLKVVAAYSQCIKENDFWKLFKGLGYMKLRGLSRYTSKAVLPIKYTCIPRCVLVWLLIYIIMIVFSSSITSEGLYSTLFYSDEGPKVSLGQLNLIYNGPSVVFVLGVSLVFTSFARLKVIYVELLDYYYYCFRPSSLCMAFSCHYIVYYISKRFRNIKFLNHVLFIIT